MSYVKTYIMLKIAGSRRRRIMGAVKEFFWKSDKKWKEMEERAEADGRVDYLKKLKKEKNEN